jgi:2-polyprenyl-3-methyl-5-hydroxy-6-metoxy-1,4-benzoquinol methylase
MIPVDEIKKMIAGLTEAQWKDLYLEHARGVRTDVVPFPHEDIQVLTNGMKGEVTAQGAISILDCVMSCINEVHPSSTKQMHVLDYGCGWGRITRLLPFYFDIERITGVDVDGQLINSASELLPYMRHKQITSMEAMPFEEGSFDIVFANSVFSHLSAKSAAFTLAELSRILRKNGVLVISILDQGHLARYYSNEKQKDWITKILGGQEQATSKLQQEGFVWGPTGRWHEYGIAITNDDWIARHLDDAGIQYRGSKKGAHRGTQSYNFGVKL